MIIMDAVGAIGSIVQILDATAKLIDYLKDVRAAEKQILSFQAEIEVIRYILCALNTSVDENPKIFHVTLTVIGAEDGILYEFNSFLVSFKGKLVAKPGRKLLWPFDKSRIKQDLEKIQRYKTILICALLNDSILLTKEIKDGVDIIKHGVEEITHSVDSISTALEQQKKHDVLEWLSPSRRIDFSQQQAALTAKRAKNTGRWLIESEPFRLWLDGKQDSIILKGGGGMGKTMLASTAIEYLTRLTAIRPERSAVAYVFGNWAHADKFNAQNLLASLLKQLLSVKGIKLPETLEELHSSKNYPTYSQLCRLLQLEAGRFSKTFIVIDALNELDEETQDKLLKILSELQTSFAIKLMVTSRDPYRILQYIASATQLDTRATKEDLNLWMDESLRALPPGCFVAKSPLETHQKIKGTLAQAADGMFLLAKLSMSAISKVSNRKKLNQALESIASGGYSLDDGYNDTMKRLKAQSSGMLTDSIILLSFVTHASRELTVSELEHALAIEVNESSFDTDNISDLREAIDSCSGLLEIDPEDQKVMLVHHTAKEYFDRTKETHFPDASAMITERCLAYLSDSNLTDSCQSYESYNLRVASFPFLEYAAQNWGFHASQGEVQRTLSANILAFLRKTSNVACSAQALLQSPDHWWYVHGSIEPQMSQDISGLHICAWFGLLLTATQLIEEEVDVNITDHNQRGPLWYAVYNRKKEAVTLLLKNGAETSTEGPLLPVFEECVRSSDPEIVEILGGFQNYSADCCGDMLKLAAQNPHCGADMAELVLNSYPSVPIEEIYEGFILSSASNHLCGKSILSMLINRGWKIPVDLNIIRVLSENMSSGADILKCLLSQGDIDPDPSIFEVAACGLASDVMEALLDYQPEFQFNVDILPLTARGNEEMFLTVLRRHPHFEVTQQMLDRLVQNTALGSAAMEALLEHAPPGTLKIDDGIVMSALKATYNGSHLIPWLLSHYENPQEKISEKILVAAVGGNDAIRILSIIKSFEPTFRVTSRMLLVAVSGLGTYTTSRSEVLQWLLQHDPTCRIDEVSMVEFLKPGNSISFDMLLSYQPQRLTCPLVFACARSVEALELLIRQGEDISDPDIIDAMTEAVLRTGRDEDWISKMLGHIQKQRLRITSASLKAAAANKNTSGAIKWVLDYDSTLEIPSELFEEVAWTPASAPKLELLEKRNRGVEMTERLFIASAKSKDVRTLRWALDRSDVVHITPRALEYAAGVYSYKTDNVTRMKLITTKNPSITITEETLRRTCQIASRDIKPLEWLLAEYPQLSLTEIPMAALLRGGQSSAVVKTIKEHLPKLNITQTLLTAAAKNEFTEKALELILTFDIGGLLSESILTTIAGSKHAASKFKVLLRLHSASVSVSDIVLRAASETPHGSGALQWLVWFSEPRKPNHTPVLPYDAMVWYLNRDPSPTITQKMLVAVAHQPWGGDVLALLLKRNPIFIISKELMEAVCYNWEFGEHQCRLLLSHHKHTRVSEDIRSAVLKWASGTTSSIYKLIREHNDDIDFR
ncbi:hypothetical protein GMDG_06766 [Pseudogymnoascus destructans 20631-21]|uniref:Uncharacterized protein n=2 Tax=Pseudogymnoascus destructans TaxID=655981 RepID=L8FVE6_PSED2|nr:hypothetical protein GMDG_06766 [Pseudogymnoascus destructans 20631-21]